MKHDSSKTDTQYVYPGQYTPLPELEQLANELKIHRGGTVVEPLMNVKDSNESFIVEVAIPGVKRENFLIAIDEQILSVALFSKHSAAYATGTFHLHEFNYDCFDRRILLPDTVNVELASASYKDGLLQIYIPKNNKPAITGSLRIVVY